MSLLSVKLRRDLRASWPRFALTVVALAVSLTVFGGMLFAWATAGRETSGAYMTTEPAQRATSSSSSSPERRHDDSRM